MQLNSADLWKAHHARHTDVWQSMDTKPFQELYEKMLNDWVSALRQGGTLYFVGNGGSSVDACHIAAELSGRYERERQPLKAMSLTANLAHITAVGNDYGYDQVFERVCRAFLTKSDVLIGLSTSGSSANVLKACQVARDVGCTVHGWTGSRGEKLQSLCDRTLMVPSEKTSVIQECSLAWGHALCAGIDAHFS